MQLGCWARKEIVIMTTPHQTAFIRGQRVYLRPPHKETDLAFFQQWINDPDIRKFLVTRDPITMVGEEKYIDSIGDRGDIIFTICLRDGTPACPAGRPIGTTGLHQINRVDGTAVTGTWIAKPYWNQGYGTEAKLLLLKVAFDTYNFRKICSSAIAYNKRSVAHNLKAGYRVEGRRKKQHYRNGKYHDEVMLACFRPWWEKKWRAHQKRR